VIYPNVQYTTEYPEYSVDKKVPIESDLKIVPVAVLVYTPVPVNTKIGVIYFSHSRHAQRACRKFVARLLRLPVTENISVHIAIPCRNIFVQWEIW
jgi:hypothetical protein